MKTLETLHYTTLHYTAQSYFWKHEKPNERRHSLWQKPNSRNVRNFL